jgi:hypothetical protein
LGDSSSRGWAKNQPNGLKKCKNVAAGARDGWGIGEPLAVLGERQEEEGYFTRQKGRWKYREQLVGAQDTFDEWLKHGLPHLIRRFEALSYELARHRDPRNPGAGVGNPS